MKRVFAILMFFTCSDVFVAAKEPDREFLVDYLKGDYIVIGKKPDADVAYHGRVTLRPRNLELEVTRMIEGTTVHGRAWFETATADKIPVLRMRFTQDGRPYEATYMWRGDLDNYGRLTGYVYLPSPRATKSPGLEALFPLEPLTRPNR